ncbi:triacylglycerol lipase [Streptomyces sp. VRA16 Mangrove soil]|uniref:esterase/lipase family protein n=1 Tax=Streptomyces sp. VRA16 Mangrove soil TaxID=2817434 RepID=UPI001A9DB445|nr:alpha/beta fold hydrolase [Streptomyces sp. VRA16 Mangrove soil]MBO1334553.1 alpha/beta fold hydrolase [Streptomyces sp. VRA16 Mangrove soil]
MRRKIFGALAASTLGISGLVALGAPNATATESERPVEHNFTSGFLNGFFKADQAPPGANDWSCRPSAEHPRPVVLIHGTLENMNDNWRGAAPLLANNGYCVYAFGYGADSASNPVQGTGAMADSAAQLGTFVDKVRAATGAAEVDLVGHSQGGGPLPRSYLKNDPGAAGKVDKLIGITPSNHGTTLSGITQLGAALHVLEPANDLLTKIGPALVEQEIGSDFNQRLDAGGDTVPGVDYTVIATKYDEVVTPYTNSFLTAGPGATVTNIRVQDACAKDLTDHLEAAYDPIVLTYVLNALDPAHPRPVPCRTVLPLTGPVG